MRTAALAILLAAFCSFGQAGALMEVEGFQGSSEEPGHFNWIECALVNSGCPSVPDPMTSLDDPPGEETGHLEGEALADVEFTVLIPERETAASAILQEFMEGSGFPEYIGMDLLSPDGEVYLDLDFQGVELNRCSEVEDGVEVVFSCQALDWEFTPR